MDCLSPIFVKVRDGPLLKTRQKVPCGRCEACVRRKQETWFTRLRLEADNQDYSCFVTLTYDDEHLPKDWNVSKEDVQRFHKRLRASLDNPKQFKFYLTSEYGPEGGRPHYHAIYFGISPMEVHKIEEKWQNGFVMVDKITDGRLRYVTGYIIEKLFVPPGRKSVFNLISKGLGLCYVESHSSWHRDLPIEQRSYVPYYGKKLALPRYYKEKLYSDEERKRYADLMEVKAADLAKEFQSKLGRDRYYNLVFARQDEFIRKVRKIHKKKKL